VIEQLLLTYAVKEWRDEQSKQRSYTYDDSQPSVERTSTTGDEGRAIADTPHLTGDPEFDAIELQETAVSGTGLTDLQREFEEYEGRAGGRHTA
jgi:hypothetical protein